MALVLQSPAEKINNTVFNVGDTSQNYTKQMLVEMMAVHAPEATVEYVQKDEDPRDYRVDFTRVREVLDFTVSRSVEQGIAEVAQMVSSGAIRNVNDPGYRN